MALVLDIETDSLDAKKIWVVITKDTKTDDKSGISHENTYDASDTKY